jgi:hypothetical protein
MAELGGPSVLQSNVIERDVEQEGAPEEPRCRHHWRIAAPNGALSHGVCKLCGEERDFANSSTDSIWENDSNDNNRWRGRGRNKEVVEPAAKQAAPLTEAALGNLLGSGYRGGAE